MGPGLKYVSRESWVRCGAVSFRGRALGSGRRVGEKEGCGEGEGERGEGEWKVWGGEVQKSGRGVPEGEEGGGGGLTGVGGEGRR